jgi:hypothetical protein
MLLGNAGSARGAPANETLDVALIGVGGRGNWFVKTMPKMENVVALCDVNERRAVAWVERSKDWAKKVPGIKSFRDPRFFPKAKKFFDYRRMIDKMQNQLDAVVVAIPDHSHALASVTAMEAGLHVYCEKPLSRLVGESRVMRETARERKVATSMGNQGTASGQFRRAIELIRGGTIGQVKEVHVWNNGGGANRPGPPKGTEPVPEGLKWDLWLGPAAERPYHHQWMHWHAWRDFGTCQLGNWASHSANLAFMALKVHELWLKPGEESPRIRVRAKVSGINRLSFPRWEHVEWDIPARADFPPITFQWHNGGSRPGMRDLLEERMGEKLDWGDAGKRKWRDHAGALIVGTKGTIHATGHNATFRLMPRGQWGGVGKDGPKELPRSRGHERDWLLACRGGAPAWANFDYADALNEFLMLGNVATQFEDELEFDPVACAIPNHAEANAALQPHYRDGWSL